MKAEVRRAGQAVLWTVGGALGAVDRLRRGPDRPLRREQVQRILAMRFGLMGDGLMVVPALHALRTAYPEARIDVLAPSYQAQIYERSGVCDRVLVWPVDRLLQPRLLARPSTWLLFWRLVRRLRTESYELAVAFYGPLAALLSYLSGARWRVGLSGESYPWLLTHPLAGRRYQRRLHELDYNLAIARRAGAALDTERLPHPSFAAVNEERAHAEVLLASHGIGQDETVVAIHPGATNGSAKRWLPERWGQLAGRLTTQLGTRVVLVGGQEDEALAAAAQAATCARLADLTGQTATFGELAAVIERCAVLAGGDSGPLHLAGALGVPVVAIYGPTDPAISGPADGARATVVRKDLPCSPCYDLRRTAECPLGHTLCMKLITVDEVYEAIAARLGGA